MKKRVLTLGFAARYHDGDHPEFRTAVWMMALSLLPGDRMAEGLALIRQEMPEDADLQALLAYVDQQWIVVGVEHLSVYAHEKLRQEELLCTESR